MKKIILVLIGVAILGLFIFSDLTGFSIFDNRPKYCLEDKCVEKTVFERLPRFPNNFNQSKKDIQTAKEDVWKQPEFYPTWESDGLKYYIDRPKDYLGYFGYGSYPSAAIFYYQGKPIETSFYVQTSWFIINFQGIKLETIIDEIYKDNFIVEINPDTLLLAPTYPFFDYNWTQKVNVKITAKNVSKGEYKIVIDAISPPEYFEEKWGRTYGKGYSSVGIFKTDTPLLEILVKI